MSIYTHHYVQCDWPGCDAQHHTGGDIATIARRRARSDGWRYMVRIRLDGAKLDVCPSHVGHVMKDNDRLREIAGKDDRQNAATELVERHRKRHGSEP